MPQTFDLIGNLSLKAGDQKNSDGAEFKARGGYNGELIASLLHGKYHQAVMDGRVFTVSNQAAVAVTAALATTYTGLALGNPITSGKKLSLLSVTLGQHAAWGTAGALGLMGAASVGSIDSDITPKNCLLGGPGSGAIVSDGCTIPTPVLLKPFGAAGTDATTDYGTLGPFIMPIDGAIVLPPNSFVAIYHSAGSTAAGIFSFMWEEVDA